MANLNKYTILYARLSNDDGSQGDSNSIINQKLMLEKYAKENNFRNTKFFYDDGYTGTNFQRPAFEEIVTLIEEDLVETLIVKDLSRLARNHVASGQFLEDFLPLHNVRFIAMHDGVDSIDEYSSDFVPIKNYFNEFYAKDCSRKIRKAVRAKAETGARVGTRAPFGYKKDPSNPKSSLIVDEEASEVVKYIFALCISGKGPTQIGAQLEADKILSPANYYYKENGVKVLGYSADTPYKWVDNSIVKILESEVYIGNTVDLTTGRLSFKNKKKIERPESDWLRFEDTHESIIDKDTWKIVQDIRGNKKRRNNFNEQNIFSGVVVCEDCGAKLVLHRSRNTDPKKYNFVCGNNKRNTKNKCSSHYIKEIDLKEIILDDLRRVTYEARENREIFVQCLAEKDNKEFKKYITKLENELMKLKSRDEELSKLFKRCYEDNILEKIPNDIFTKLSSEYLREQDSIQELIEEKSKEVEKLKGSETNVNSFIEKAKKYSEITELTAELLNIFIEKIEVSERSIKNSRNATQKISIHYRDIGLVWYHGDTQDIA